MTSPVVRVEAPSPPPPPSVRTLFQQRRLAASPQATDTSGGQHYMQSPQQSPAMSNQGNVSPAPQVRLYPQQQRNAAQERNTPPPANIQRNSPIRPGPRNRRQDGRGYQIRGMRNENEQLPNQFLRLILEHFEDIFHVRIRP